MRLPLQRMMLLLPLHRPYFLHQRFLPHLQHFPWKSFPPPFRPPFGPTSSSLIQTPMFAFPPFGIPNCPPFSSYFPPLVPADVGRQFAVCPASGATVTNSKECISKSLTSFFAHLIYVSLSQFCIASCRSFTGCRSSTSTASSCIYGSCRPWVPFATCHSPICLPLPLSVPTLVMFITTRRFLRSLSNRLLIAHLIIPLIISP